MPRKLVFGTLCFLMANVGKCFNGDAHTAVTLLLVDVYEFSVIQ